MGFLTDHCDYEPGKAQKVANVKDNNSELNDLKNLSEHDQLLYVNNINLNVFCFDRVIFDNIVELAFFIRFVDVHYMCEINN